MSTRVQRDPLYQPQIQSKSAYRMDSLSQHLQQYLKLPPWDVQPRAHPMPSIATETSVPCHNAFLCSSLPGILAQWVCQLPSSTLQVLFRYQAQGGRLTGCSTLEGVLVGKIRDVVASGPLASRATDPGKSPAGVASAPVSVSTALASRNFPES